MSLASKWAFQAPALVRLSVASAASALIGGAFPLPSIAAESVVPDGTPIFKTLHVMRTHKEGRDLRAVMQASDGNLYGVAAVGGAHNRGTLYRMNHDRVVEVLHAFGAFAGDGQDPNGRLLEASDGNFCRSPR